MNFVKCGVLSNFQCRVTVDFLTVLPAVVADRIDMAFSRSGAA